MDTPTRLRLYQYTYSPFCIPIELALRDSGLPYDIVNLHVGDPPPMTDQDIRDIITFLHTLDDGYTPSPQVAMSTQP